MKPIDRTGYRVGSLVVTGLASRTDKDSNWVCLCDCGNTVIRRWSGLAKGYPASCGCRHGKTIHGHARRGKKTRIYTTWKGMMQRCYDANHAAFKNYGGRGIQVCKKWHAFAKFFADVGEPPAGLTLDRIDNDGDYCKSNCYWATRSQQARNRRARSVPNVRDEKGRFVA